MGESWESPGTRLIVRDLETILRAGLYDLRAEKLRALPHLTIMGAREGAPASARQIRDRILKLVNAIGPGPTGDFACALFGASPETRSLELQGRREVAGQVVRPERPISAEGIRKRPSGREWKLLRYLAGEIAAGEGAPEESDDGGLAHRLLALEGSDKLRAFWRLGRRSSVDIVCSEIPDEERPYFADPSDRNYLRYAKFADLDSLIYVRIRLAQLYPSLPVRDFAPSEHYDTNADALVVIGGPPWNATFREFQARLPLHFEPRSLGEDDPLILDDADGRTLAPTWTSTGTLRSDIALFVRLTLEDGPLVYLLGGCLTHGVLGAAKCFLDPRTAPANINFIEHYAHGLDFVLVCDANRIGGFLETPNLSSRDPLTLLVRDDNSTNFRSVLVSLEDA
jgi:hypothetical protein